MADDLTSQAMIFCAKILKKKYLYLSVNPAVVTWLVAIGVIVELLLHFDVNYYLIFL